jgi:hypothetical protein
MKGKCSFCEIDLPDKSNIRCNKCDLIWQAGARFGGNEIRNKVREVLRALNNLGKED